MRRSIVLSALLAFAIAPAGCDSGDDGKAAADAKKSAKEKEMEEGLKKRKEERAAKEKAKEEAAQKKKDALAALATLPEELPKKLDKACDEVAQANDRFMNRLYTGDGLKRWNEAKGTQMPLTKAQCNKTGSIEVAACQVAAMDAAPEEFKKDLPDILRACIEKYGPNAKPAEGEAAPAEGGDAKAAKKGG